MAWKQRDRIMQETPCPILVVTATVQGNSAKVYEALGHGALDAVNTPVLGPQGDVSGAEPLLRKIRCVTQLRGGTAAGLQVKTPRVTHRRRSRRVAYTARRDRRFDGWSPGPGKTAERNAAAVVLCCADCAAPRSAVRTRPGRMARDGNRDFRSRLLATTSPCSQDACKSLAPPIT